MTKLLLTLALTIWAGSAYAQSTIKKSLLCGKANDVIPVIMEKFSELPIWKAKGTGDDANTIIVMLLNKETGSWTILQTTKDIACILAEGEQLIPADRSF